MAPTGAPQHFWLSLSLTIGSAAAWWLIRRRRNDALLAPIAGFCGAMAAGIVKEVHDLVANPWGLAAVDLRADAAADMAWNFAGAVAGGLIWACAAAIAAAGAYYGSSAGRGMAWMKSRREGSHEMPSLFADHQSETSSR